MEPMLINKNQKLARNHLSVYIFMALFGLSSNAYSVEFNTDLLDSEDKNNIDLSRFSQAGYIMPGAYSLGLRLNDQIVSDQDITFIEDKDENGQPIIKICLTRDQVLLIGLKEDAFSKIKFDEHGHCADFSALEGVSLRGELSESTLYASVPQAWLEYQDSSWLPPSRWENGISGLLLDYNINTNLTKPQTGNQNQSASASGTVGANIDAWRLRADYQAQYNHTTGSDLSSSQRFDWSRVYAYRAITSMMAKLTLGEDYLSSDIFDSWRFTGATLASDESQLPPKLRGYAPEVTGIAKTNAKVSITQQGRVIYETTVAAGPFRIQELNGATSGQLDVRVEEQDGSVQTYQVTTASVPYLTRPGQVRYKFAIGRPTDYNHNTNGPLFATTEASWGVSNTWSLYGGTAFTDAYQSLAFGLGRDLYQLGAISADVTQAVAKVPGDEQRTGRSYRVSYSKRFEQINSEVTFAGYRFSEKDYISMSDFVSLRESGVAYSKNKELYTITANKSFTDLRLSSYLSWTHQTYWDRKDNDSYSTSASKYFDAGNFKNISASLSATRRNYNGRKDDAAYISLSIPFGSGTASYSGNWSNDQYIQSAGWYERLSNGDSYRISAGSRSGNNEGMTAEANGYYTHSGDISDMTANVNWSQDNYISGGMSLSGGVTASTKGVALHPSSGNGGTRMLVSTDGVAGVPIGYNGKTNMFGIAVDPNFASYYRSSTSIDVNRLPDDIEASGSPVAEAALTEGAIGYRKFSVLQGQKMVATITLKDGSHPPFGATVKNNWKQELGMVSDGGLAWLIGVTPGEVLNVYWSDKAQCEISLPKVIPANHLLLPCQITQNINTNSVDSD